MSNRQSSIENLKSKDFLFLHLQDLPYFRALIRGVEATYYQDFDLPAPVYDVGCGDGHFASLTFDQKIDVGLDPWHGPIHQAKKYGAYRGLVEADGASLPFQTITLPAPSATRCWNTSRTSTRCWLKPRACSNRVRPSISVSRTRVTSRNCRFHAYWKMVHGMVPAHLTRRARGRARCLERTPGAGWFRADPSLGLFLSVRDARVRMGSLFWPAFCGCACTDRQMDHQPRPLEFVADRAFCEEVCFTRTGRGWHFYVLCCKKTIIDICSRELACPGTNSKYRFPIDMSFDEKYFSSHTYQDVSFAKYSMYWWSNRFYAMLARRHGQHGGRLLEIGSGLGHLIGQLEDSFETYAHGFEPLGCKRIKSSC